MAVKICPDTGNEEIALGEYELDNSIRLIYRVRNDEMAVVSNTRVGYVSVVLPKRLDSCLAPWSGGRILTGNNSVSISLTEEDYAVAVEFLESHGVTVQKEVAARVESN